MPLGVEVGLIPGDFVLDGDPAPPIPKRAELPNCRLMSVSAKQLHGSRWHLAWRWALVQGTRPHCARWEHSSPPQKRGQSPPPQFLAHFYCGQTAGCIKMPLGMQVGLSPSNFVLDGDPAPPQKGQSPQFSAHVYCGQTAGWTKMPLGTEVDLGPVDIVLDGVPALCERGHSSPLFLPISVVATVAHLSYC